MTGATAYSRKPSLRLIATHSRTRQTLHILCQVSTIILIRCFPDALLMQILIAFLSEKDDAFYMKRKAQLIMTGHTLTLFIGASAVFVASATIKDMDQLKKMIGDMKDELEFSENCFISFPWLCDLLNQQPRWKCDCGTEIFDRYNDCPQCGKVKP